MAKTNYNKMANSKPKTEEVAAVETGSLEIEQTTNEIETPVIEKKPEKKTKFGVVTGCIRLNVRNNPHPNAHIELVIDNGTEVEIIESNGDFYHVRKGTVTEGFTGWCMKKYISVKK